MNGGADLGGMMGFGPVIEEPDEPNFHAQWEERVLGITVALGACGQWNIDQSRFARESLPPAIYLSSSYYEIWYRGIVKLLKQNHMISDKELATAQASLPRVDECNALLPENVEATLMAGSPANRKSDQPAAFDVGQQVRTINIHPETHTRLPRYARDKTGIISKVHGVHVLPDTSAVGQGEQATWLYKVSFDAQTLWGDTRVNEQVNNKATNKDKVHLDLWQPYLKADTTL